MLRRSNVRPIKFRRGVSVVTCACTGMPESCIDKPLLAHAHLQSVYSCLFWVGSFRGIDFTNGLGRLRA